MAKRATAMIERGIISFDPTDPRRRLRLELHVSEIGLLLLLVPACVLLLVPWAGAGMRAVGLLVIAAIPTLNFHLARSAFESWVRVAAERAGARFY